MIKLLYLTIDRTLLGAAAPGQSGSRCDGSEGILYIHQRSSITEASASDCLVSYPGNSLDGCLTPLLSCSRCILQPFPLFGL